MTESIVSGKAYYFAIASKEARESRYWLRLLSDSGIVKDFDFTGLLTEIEEIVKILTRIVKTTQLDTNQIR